MQANHFIDRLTKACPEKHSWIREPYGPYKVHPFAPIRRALFCVTPTNEVVKEFLDGKYDVLISHHPFIRGVPQVILHTALDCCPGGLNDQWRDALGVKDARHFDKELGWAGQIEPQTFESLRKKVDKFIGQPTEGMAYSDKHIIESVVICTGLGGMVENKAYESGADCYILGEATSDPLKSSFPAMIEVGHTVSEYRPGLLFVLKALEGTGIEVTGAKIGNDYYSNETYQPPLSSFSREFRDFWEPA